MTISVSRNVIDQNLKNLFSLIMEEHPKVDLVGLRDALIDTSVFAERVPLEIVSKNINTISQFLEEPMLGIKIIDRFDLSTIPFIQVIRNQIPMGQDYVGKMIIFLSEYFSTISEVVDIHLTWRENSLTMDIDRSEAFVSDVQIEGAMYGIVKILHSLSNISPQTVQFAHAHQENSDRYRSYFQVQPIFSAASNQIVYQAKQGGFEILSDKTIKAVSGLNALLKKEFPESDIIQQTKTILKSTLHFGEPSRERVANVLNMSVSSLKRHLKEHQISFKDLLLSLRKEMAEDMLLNQNIKASQVGFLLGYSDSTRFYRAFKSWYGVTAGEFKKSRID